MHVLLNGNAVLLSHTLTLTEFLKKHGVAQQTGGIAVAVNGQIVFRANWASLEIKENDQIEIVHAVSGG